MKLNVKKLQQGQTIELTLPNGLKKKVETNSKEYKSLYPNVTTKINEDTYYKNLPDVNITAKNWLSHSVRKAMNEAGKNMMTGIGAAALIGTGAAGLVSAPVAFIGGTAGGIAGDYLTNKATDIISKGKYKNWGEFAGDKTGISAETMAFTNPGAVVGGGFGLIGGSLPVVGRFIKGVGNVTSPLIKKVVNNYKFNKLEKEAFKSPIYKLIQNNKGTFVEPSYEINNSNINDLILQSVKNTDGANIHGTIEKDGFIYLIKRASEHNNTPEITSRLKSYPEIIPVHQSALVGNKSGYLNIQLQNKASGNYLHKIPEEDLHLITQKQINDAKAALEAGSKEGLDFDFLGDNNVFYDPKKGFQFIDLGTSGRFSKGKDAIEGFRSKLKHGITKSTDYPADYWLNLKNLKLGLIPAGLYGLTQSKKQGGKLIPKEQQGLSINNLFTTYKANKINPIYLNKVELDIPHIDKITNTPSKKENLISFKSSPHNFLNLPKPESKFNILNMNNIGYDSNTVLNLIDKFEGFKDKVYKDGNGIDTIGHGLTDKKYTSKKIITKEESLLGVKSHIDKEVIPHLKNKPYWNKLNDNQKSALISYVYNIGSGNFNTKSLKLQNALNKSDWEEAANQMNFGYNDSKNPGLRKRRDQERALFLSK